MAARTGLKTARMLHGELQSSGVAGHEQEVQNGTLQMAAQRDSAFVDAGDEPAHGGRSPIAHTCMFMMSVYARTNWLRTASVA